MIERNDVQNIGKRTATLQKIDFPSRYVRITGDIVRAERS